MSLKDTPMNAEDSRERMAANVTDCDYAILISFKDVVDDAGEKKLMPTINYHGINMATLMMAHDILHRGYAQRLEYVMLDYARMLREEGTLAKGESNEEDGSDPGNGTGADAPVGDSPDNR